MRTAHGTQLLAVRAKYETMCDWCGKNIPPQTRFLAETSETKAPGEALDPGLIDHCFCKRQCAVENGTLLV